MDFFLYLVVITDSLVRYSCRSYKAVLSNPSQCKSPQKSAVDLELGHYG